MNCRPAALATARAVSAVIGSRLAVPRMPSVPNSLRVILRSWLRPPPLPYTPLLIPQFLISGAALMRSATRTLRRPGEILGRRRRGGGSLPEPDHLRGTYHVVNTTPPNPAHHRERSGRER